MIYLNNILITEDTLFEKSRATHESFNQKRVVYKATTYSRNKTDEIVHYFKLFKKGLSVDFKAAITIITGDNGTGKSSLLRLLKFKAWEKVLWDDTPEEESKRQHMLKYLKSDSRTLSFLNYPAGIYFLDGLHKGIIGGQVQDELAKIATGMKKGNLRAAAAMFNAFQPVSNGEALLDIYDGLKNEKNSLIILDEPETSMSLKSVAKLCDMFKTLVANGNQLIISTHHPYFMKLSGEIYDIEKKKYVATDKYLKSIEHGN